MKISVFIIKRQKQDKNLHIHVKNLKKYKKYVKILCIAMFFEVSHSANC